MSIIVGITGQTGAGKTTACEYFVGRGFGIINCDKVSREVTTIDSECLNLLVEEFSSSILNQDKTLNRRALGQLVFSNKQKLERLNQIMHPAIMKRVLELVDDLEKSFSIILLDAPTLFESGADKLCDKIIAIVSSEKKSVARIIMRDNINEDMAVKRLSSQYDRAFFIANSNYIIENDSSKLSFQKKLNEVASKLEEIKTQ